MKKLELKVSFVTPAFLGNAEQQGQWRTPPFKALLRQWWRVVVVAKDCNYDVCTLRQREAELFGSAAGEKNMGQSKVRLRLGAWEQGGFKENLKDAKAKHPEVKFPVGSALYLGYGPIGYEKGKGTVVKMPHSIAPGDTNTLRLGFPLANNLEKSVQLAAWFGTLGSRCRNGWGSIVFAGDGIDSMARLLDGEADVARFCCPLENCLRLDWPHAFGSDHRGMLIWKTQPFNDWQQAMKRLAEIKIAFRTHLNVNGGFQDRHLLAYPVTHHSVHEWGNQTRLSNQMRFKVVYHRNKYIGLIFHLPCDIPADLKKRLHHPPSHTDQMRIWQKTHQVLDKELHRIGGAS